MDKLPWSPTVAVVFPSVTTVKDLDIPSQHVVRCPVRGFVLVESHTFMLGNGILRPPNLPRDFLLPPDSLLVLGHPSVLTLTQHIPIQMVLDERVQFHFSCPFSGLVYHFHPKASFAGSTSSRPDLRFAGMA
uniref:Uncharacterized protein n=1 Tax=Timema douglasi TaxID=61478 RepID=A0A7R8VSD0_TIMDO|nr:unnamed protein product [Timema douglasi]